MQQLGDEATGDRFDQLDLGRIETGEPLGVPVDLGGTVCLCALAQRSHQGRGLESRRFDAESLDFLANQELTVANLDYPTAADSFDMPLCRIGKRPYLRLHGRNHKAWFSKAGRNETYDYLYSRDELDEIAKRAAALAKHSEGLIAVANNHFQGKEMVNILELKAKITGKPVDAPPLLAQHYPRLRQ